MGMYEAEASELTGMYAATMHAEQYNSERWVTSRCSRAGKMDDFKHSICKHYNEQICEGHLHG